MKKQKKILKQRIKQNKMKLINQSVEIWQQPKGEIGIYKQIERAARLCYRSGDKTTEDSYKRFMTMLEDKKHRSPYEHGSVYLKVPMHIVTNTLAESAWDILRHNPYTRTDIDYSNYYYSTNMRVIIENHLEEVLLYLCEPTKYHHKRISVHITTSLGISRELNRHRCHSICEESTRYCNYSKDKFGNELTFIKPNWIDLPTGTYHYSGSDWIISQEDGVKKVLFPDTSATNCFITSCSNAEMSYMSLINQGLKPQQAREVLPLATKTELVHTAFEDDWQAFFKLRCSPAAHPMMQELANMTKELMCKNDKV